MKGMLFILLAAFVAYVYSQGISINCPPYNEDREESVFVPHPCNCSTYFDCNTPVPTAMPCPPGLHYSPQEKRCDWPWIVKCKPVAGCKKTMLDDDESILEEDAV